LPKFAQNKQETMASFNDLIKSETPLLVAVISDWATPSEQLSPILKKAKNQFSSDLNIIKIDAEKNKAIPTKFNIIGLPCLILFKSGTKHWQQSGIPDEDQLFIKIKELV